MGTDARAKVTQAAAKKIQEGDELYTKIAKGEDLQPATTKDVTDLVWALKSSG